MPAVVVADAEARQQALAFLAQAEARRNWRSFYQLVHRTYPVDLGNNEWLLARRDDVLAAMRSRDAELTALYPATRPPALNEILLGMLPFESGSEHQRLRSIVKALFTAKSVSRLNSEIRCTVDEVLYPCVFEEDGCDVLETLGVRIPERTSCLLLDVADADTAVVGAWAREMYAHLGRYDQTAEELEDADDLVARFRKYVRCRCDGRAEATIRGGIGEALVAARRNGELTEEEVVAYFALFMLTGLDTLTYAVGNALWFLGNRPDIFTTLRRHDRACGAAFAETMRLWGPVRLCVRHLHAPVRLETEELPAGSLVFLMLHAANRDPDAFADPGEFRWDRETREDLAYGVGPHGCLGTAVGRLVGRSLFESLIAHCASIEATPGLEDVDFVASLPMLGVADVRVWATPS